MNIRRPVSYNVRRRWQSTPRCVRHKRRCRVLSRRTTPNYRTVRANVSADNIPKNSTDTAESIEEILKKTNRNNEMRRWKSISPSITQFLTYREKTNLMKSMSPETLYPNNESIFGTWNAGNDFQSTLNTGERALVFADTDKIIQESRNRRLERCRNVGRRCCLSTSQVNRLRSSGDMEMKRQLSASYYNQASGNARLEIKESDNTVSEVRSIKRHGTGEFGNRISHPIQFLGRHNCKRSLSADSTDRFSWARLPERRCNVRKQWRSTSPLLKRYTSFENSEFKRPLSADTNANNSVTRRLHERSRIKSKYLIHLKDTTESDESVCTSRSLDRESQWEEKRKLNRSLSAGSSFKNDRLLEGHNHEATILSDCPSSSKANRWTQSQPTQAGEKQVTINECQNSVFYYAQSSSTSAKSSWLHGVYVGKHMNRNSLHGSETHTNLRSIRADDHTTTGWNQTSEETPCTSNAEEKTPSTFTKVEELTKKNAYSYCTKSVLNGSSSTDYSTFFLNSTVQEPFSASKEDRRSEEKSIAPEEVPTLKTPLKKWSFLWPPLIHKDNTSRPGLEQERAEIQKVCQEKSIQTSMESVHKNGVLARLASFLLCCKECEDEEKETKRRLKITIRRRDHGSVRPQVCSCQYKTPRIHQRQQNVQRTGFSRASPLRKDELVCYKANRPKGFMSIKPVRSHLIKNHPVKTDHTILFPREEQPITSQHASSVIGHDEHRLPLSIHYPRTDRCSTTTELLRINTPKTSPNMRIKTPKHSPVMSIKTLKNTRIVKNKTPKNSPIFECPRKTKPSSSVMLNIAPSGISLRAFGANTREGHAHCVTTEQDRIHPYYHCYYQWPHAQYLQPCCHHGRRELNFNPLHTVMGKLTSGFCNLKVLGYKTYLYFSSRRENARDTKLDDGVIEEQDE